MGKYKGGYTIIDLQNLQLMEGEQYHIDGIYNACEEALKSRKAVLLTNVDITTENNTQIKNDLFVNLEYQENDKLFYMYIGERTFEYDTYIVVDEHDGIRYSLI